ncbi:ribosome silencing factor [Desulfoplanes sp.]
MSKKNTTHIQERLEQIAAWLHEKKARGIVMLDVRGYSSVTEGMIIATANSARQAKSMSSWLVEQGKQHGGPVLGVEGAESGQWILVDFNDVVVHIFQKEVRELYNIEGLFTGVGRIDPGFEERSDG